MALAGVTVTVEPVLEHQIQEVKLDGQEVYVPPLSMSENLSKLAHKIDFYKDESEGKGKPTSEGEKDGDEEKVLAPFQPSLWPWDSVRNKLKSSLTEISVLLDVLNLAKEKRYMVAENVSQESPDQKASLQLLSKKKSLIEASACLMRGADRLKKSQIEASNRTQNDFHIELLKLRQNWRLKRVGNTIFGDLSYKSAGSRFMQAGTFEVVKSSESTLEPEAGGPKSCLEVHIPSELEGVAYIQVEVKSVPDMMDLTSATLKMPAGLGSVPSDAYWQQKLEVAQNVLFCKELFAQLAREAVQVKGTSPHMVISNQIITNVFPGIQLCIVLCHYTGKEKKMPLSPQKLEHNHVLEHSLHQLLREVHYRNVNLDPPHPMYATLGMTKRRRMAGPQGVTRGELIQMAARYGRSSDTLLEQIIKQTKHAVLRVRTMHLIDELAVSIQDPQITAHWNCLNNSLQSSVRINITSYGYESVRTHLSLVIGVDSIQVILKDGRTCTLSFEDKELKDLIHWQVSQFHVLVVQQLVKFQGWLLLSLSGGIGSGDMETFGTAASIMFASPKGDRVLALKSGPSSGLTLSMKNLDPCEYNKSSPVTDPKWFNLGGQFKAINLDRLEGRNFASKMDMLMAKLTSG
ncbi:mediator of RNA polymerase II transcription subunit 17-like isoform X1 [Haliotis rufescens]|uniref:mediator of RNA polymerase II transcription subunit 17-like isoform X1 n=1 Tax=Haliotis rufescens TaxID=6454 RepID=UPI001EAFDE3D|nr:mediator of RNA polymerase II transcription subunit 17-like isoform X1 [Haliotis rufescens]